MNPFHVSDMLTNIPSTNVQQPVGIECWSLIWSSGYKSQTELWISNLYAGCSAMAICLQCKDTQSLLSFWLARLTMKIYFDLDSMLCFTLVLHNSQHFIQCIGSSFTNFIWLVMWYILSSQPRNKFVWNSLLNLMPMGHILWDKHIYWPLGSCRNCGHPLGQGESDWPQTLTWSLIWS
jgi:hypothetical protein